eukprot:s3059_g10.t1
MKTNGQLRWLYAHGIPRCMDYTSIAGPDVRDSQALDGRPTGQLQRKKLDQAAQFSVADSLLTWETMHKVLGIQVFEAQVHSVRL